MLALLLVACTATTDFIVRDTAIFIDDISETATGPQAPCLTDAQSAVLEEHLTGLTVVAESLPYPPTGASLPMYFELPGVSAGAPYTLDLTTSCPEGDPGPPICDALVCYTSTCAADGGWTVDANNVPDTPTATGTTTESGWTVYAALQSTTWAPPQSVYTATWEEGRITSADGEDWTMSGSATFDGTLSLTESYRGLVPDVDEVDVEIAGGAGRVVLWGVEIATWDGTTLTQGDCSE